MNSSLNSSISKNDYWVVKSKKKVRQQGTLSFHYGIKMDNYMLIFVDTLLQPELILSTLGRERSLPRYIRQDAVLCAANIKNKF